VRRPHAEAERRRDHRAEDVVGGEAARLERELVEVEPAALVVHDALREPGRARSRVQQEDVVGREAERGIDRLEAAAAGELAFDDDVMRQGAADLAADRGEVEIAVRRVRHERPRARAAQQMRELDRPRARPDPDRDEARLLDADPRGVHAGSVG
jgi:hypothetical protein